jgi:ubiquinone/menaquinone biosynthesis C-methylase UbiE
MDVIYDDLWTIADVERWARSVATFQPRPPSILFDMVADLGLDQGASILDVGCGQGDHACELAARFGSHVTAVDPVESSLESTRQRVERMHITSQVEVEHGLIEQLSFADATFDLVWCRSVIVHLPDLLPAFRQCWRVLVPGGSMLLQTGFATDLLEPREADLLCGRLGFIPTSLDRSHVEEALDDAAFTTIRSLALGSEFAEFYEDESGRCARDLVGIARLQREEAESVLRFGRPAYETALGMYYWQVYQMLGKISYHAYLLRKNL